MMGTADGKEAELGVSLCVWCGEISRMRCEISRWDGSASTLGKRVSIIIC